MNISKIVTHGGMFHADEVLSIAFLRLVGITAPVERTFTPSTSDLEDRTVIVLDVGKRFESIIHNYDHHQNPDLPATNMLLLTWFEQDVIPTQILDQLSIRLFQRVSDIDRGLAVLTDSSIPEFNALIRNFNTLSDGFDRALIVAQEILTAMVETSRKAIADESRWDALAKTNGIAFQHDDDAIFCWKQKAKEEGIYLLVCPNPRGGYSVISRDSAELVIPVHPSQTFRHNSGFMATYPTPQIATGHAMQIVDDYLKSQPLSNF